jgi:hypothetical protein
VYGYQKSFFYKLIKCAEIDFHTLEKFKAKCDEMDAKNLKSQRNLETLLKFAKDETCLDGDSDGDSDGEEKIETIFTLAFKSETNVAVRVNANSEIETKNSKEEILEAIKFLQSLI